MALLFWSGPVITSAGYGGCGVAIILTPLALCVVCVLTPNYPVWFGLAVATAIYASCVMTTGRVSIAHGDYMYWTNQKADFWNHFLALCLFCGFSLVVSIPVSRARRKAKPGDASGR